MSDAMGIYLIALNEPNATAWEAVQSQWPDRCHILTDRMAFIAPTDSVLTQTIADAIGMNAEKDVLGIVVELGHKSGFNNSTLNEWLSKFS